MFKSTEVLIDYEGLAYKLIAIDIQAAASRETSASDHMFNVLRQHYQKTLGTLSQPVKTFNPSAANLLNLCDRISLILYLHEKKDRGYVTSEYPDILKLYSKGNESIGTLIGRFLNLQSMILEQQLNQLEQAYLHTQSSSSGSVSTLQKRGLFGTSSSQRPNEDLSSSPPKAASNIPTNPPPEGSLAEDLLLAAPPKSAPPPPIQIEEDKELDDLLEEGEKVWQQSEALVRRSTTLSSAPDLLEQLEIYRPRLQKLWANLEYRTIFLQYHKVQDDLRCHTDLVNYQRILSTTQALSRQTYQTLLLPLLNAYPIELDFSLSRPASDPDLRGLYNPHKRSASVPEIRPLSPQSNPQGAPLPPSRPIEASQRHSLYPQSRRDSDPFLLLEQYEQGTDFDRTSIEDRLHHWASSSPSLSYSYPSRRASVDSIHYSSAAAAAAPHNGLLRRPSYSEALSPSAATASSSPRHQIVALAFAEEVSQSSTALLARICSHHWIYAANDSSEGCKTCGRTRNFPLSLEVESTIRRDATHSFYQNHRSPSNSNEVTAEQCTQYVLSQLKEEITKTAAQCQHPHFVQSKHPGIKYCKTCLWMKTVPFKIKICIHKWKPNEDDKTLQTCEYCQGVRQHSHSHSIAQSCYHRWQQAGSLKGFEYCQSCKLFRATLVSLPSSTASCQHGEWVAIPGYCSNESLKYCGKCGLITTLEYGKRLLPTHLKEICEHLWQRSLGSTSQYCTSCMRTRDFTLSPEEEGEVNRTLSQSFFENPAHLTSGDTERMFDEARLNALEMAINTAAAECSHAKGWKQSEIQDIQYCPDCLLMIPAPFEEKVCIHAWVDNQDDRDLQICQTCGILRAKFQLELHAHEWGPAPNCPGFDYCLSCKLFRHHDSSTQPNLACKACHNLAPVSSFYTPPDSAFNYCKQCGKISSVSQFFKNLRDRPLARATASTAAMPPPTTAHPREERSAPSPPSAAAAASSPRQSPSVTQRLKKFFS